MGPKKQQQAKGKVSSPQKLPSVAPKSASTTPSPTKKEIDQKVSLPVIVLSDEKPTTETEEKPPPPDEPLTEKMVQHLCSFIAYTVATEYVNTVLRPVVEPHVGGDVDTPSPPSEAPPSEGEPTPPVLLAGVIDEVIELEKIAKFERENGKVILLYEMYNEEFDIKDGKIQKEYIDEEYCLSDIMPSCAIHLSIFEKKEIYVQIDEGNADTFLKDDDTTIFNLEVGNSYTVFVEQHADQLARDQEFQKKIAATMEGAVDPNAPPPLVKDDGRPMESCSCIYGNPCMDEYGCRNWHERFAISTANGWKGF
jgi:hypothetical protein